MHRWNKDLNSMHSALWLQSQRHPASKRIQLQKLSFKNFVDLGQQLVTTKQHTCETKGEQKINSITLYIHMTISGMLSALFCTVHRIWLWTPWEHISIVVNGCEILFTTNQLFYDRILNLTYENQLHSINEILVACCLIIRIPKQSVTSLMYGLWSVVRPKITWKGEDDIDFRSLHLYDRNTTGGCK